LENTLSVGVKNGGIFMKCKAENRPCCVAPNSRESHKILESIRELSIIVRDNIFGNLVKTSGSKIVTKRSPELLQLLDRRRSECFKRGILVKKFIVFGDYSGITHTIKYV
jgi:hypothetical protein